jgi:hypothetical protein
LHPLDQEKIALSRFSVSCVSVFSTRGLLLPTKVTKYSIYQIQADSGKVNYSSSEDLAYDEYHTKTFTSVKLSDSKWSCFLSNSNKKRNKAGSLGRRVSRA